MTKMTQTTTSVHSEEAMKLGRTVERLHENDLMLSVAMGTQLLVLGALYLMPTVSTSSWWATLLLLLPTMALFGIASLAARGMAPDALKTPWYRAVMLVFALFFFSDMAMSLLSVVELVHAFILPSSSRMLLALATAVVIALGIPAKRPAAVARTARFLRWFFAAAYAFCIVTVLPQGNAGYLSPWAGYGVAHTLRGTCFMCGGVWSVALLPLLSHHEDRRARKRARCYLPPLLCVIILSALFLCCAYVLPGAMLSGSWGYALRLQLLMEISPNTLSWSLMLLCELMLFLTAFSAAGSLCSSCMQKALRLRRFPILLPALGCVPLAVIGVAEAEETLIALLPWRYPITLALVLVSLCCNALLKRKKPA